MYESGECTAQEAQFTMGLLKETPWQAGWVGGIRIDAKCYLYRHEWVAKKPVHSAAAFVASPNYNVFTVNGKKPDDSVLNNTFANYDKSLYYATYDLTGIVQEGPNAIGVMTGLGWRSLREAEDGVGWGDSLFALQLMVEYTDGTEEWLYSHPDEWRCATDGPVVYNSIYNGEIYDARLEKSGWDSPGYDASGWMPTVEKEPPEGLLRSQLLGPIRDVTEPVKSMQRVDFTACGGGSCVLDVKLPLSGHMTPPLFAAFIRACGEYGCPTLQPNVVSQEDLLDARIHPEAHQDLIVRICGLSAYFVALTPQVQEEIIARTLYEG